MFRKQYFVFGASVAYGVGGTQGGWSSLLKRHVHSELYGNSSLGEKAEVYNFAKPGAKIEFVLDTFENQLLNYERECPLVAFVSVGLNDTKAMDNADDYVSNEVEFEKSYNELLTEMSKYFETINVLGFHKVDESKVCPKINPFDGSVSYFNNNRIQNFNEKLKQLCSYYDKVNFADMSKLSDNWINDCLFEDGLHPNDKGHKLMFDALKGFVKI